MFVVKNAWKSVTRNKGRNMLIIVIVTIIAAAATIGLSIRQAAATARSSGLDNTTVTAQISLDRGKLISESREQSKSDSDSSDASAKPDFDAMRSALADHGVGGDRRFPAGHRFVRFGFLQLVRLVQYEGFV